MKNKILQKRLSTDFLMLSTQLHVLQIVTLAADMLKLEDNS